MNRQPHSSGAFPIRILIVDDHPNTATTLARAVSQLGSKVEVISATSGREALERVQSGKDGEIRLINAFQLLTGKMPLYGYEIEGKRYDTGDKLGFLQATIDFALKRKDLGPAFEKYMKDLFCKPKK